MKKLNIILWILVVLYLVLPQSSNENGIHRTPMFPLFIFVIIGVILVNVGLKYMEKLGDNTKASVSYLLELRFIILGPLSLMFVLGLDMCITYFGVTLNPNDKFGIGFHISCIIMVLNLVIIIICLLSKERSKEIKRVIRELEKENDKYYSSNHK